MTSSHSQQAQVGTGGSVAPDLAFASAAARVSAPARTLSVDYSLTRHALTLAIGSLLLAGCFSLLLIVGRLPVISTWISDPQLFKRGLVLHVDLALVVWFFSFAAGLFALLPADHASHRMFRFGIRLAALGVLAMIVGTLIPGTLPVLANYVPVIDHPVYISGVALFLGGILFCFVNDRLFVRVPEVTAQAPAAAWEPLRVTPDAATALKTAGLAFLLAITTFLVSWAGTPQALDPQPFYELVFWGGGHVLQVANVAAMLAVWLLLLSSLLKAPVLKPGAARVLFALLLAPHLIGPLLTFGGTITGTYRLGFTRLMQFGIAPVVLIVLGLCLRELRRAWRTGRIGRSDLCDVRLIGFSASAALTVTGFLLGSAIRNSNTMIPAHYHASIGAVTVAFMAVTYPLLKPLGLGALTARAQRLIPWQLSLFGFGQVIFAIGFGLGGMHGLSRKAYAAEQHVRTWGEYAGLGIMSFGGLIAVAGGLMFLALMVSAAQDSLFRPRPRPRSRSERSVGVMEYRSTERRAAVRSRNDSRASHSISPELQHCLPDSPSARTRTRTRTIASLPLSPTPFEPSTRSHA